jgi:uncharacterized protein YerC
MTQISKLQLPKALENQMNTIFHRALADLRSEGEVSDFLEDLLTPTERVMLGKRLAIAVLLDKGYDQRTIHTIMKVSVSTVSSVNYWLKNKGSGYRNVLARLKNQKEWQELKAGLEDFLKTFFSASRQRRLLYPRIPKEATPRNTLY